LTRLYTSSFLPDRLFIKLFIPQKLLAFYPLRSSAWIVMVLCHRDTLYLGLVLGHHKMAQEHSWGIGDVITHMGKPPKQVCEHAKFKHTTYFDSVNHLYTIYPYTQVPCFVLHLSY
jgi:hypothetical protein